MDAMKSRKRMALRELARLIKDKNSIPINYNHYYTENVHKSRGKRLGDQLEKHVPNASHLNPPKCSLGNHYYHSQTDTKGELGRVISQWSDAVSADMEDFSCEEALDCLKAIYKVNPPGPPSNILHVQFILSRSSALTNHQTGPNEGLHGQRHGPSR